MSNVLCTVVLRLHIKSCWQLRDLSRGGDLPQRYGLSARRERQAMERPDPLHLTLTILVVLTRLQLF